MATRSGAIEWLSESLSKKLNLSSKSSNQLLKAASLCKHDLVSQIIGELCFNTSILGYQEILTDPSYSNQIITFTFPHIGNVGVNKFDVESKKPAAKGLVIREDITKQSNFRATDNLQNWLIKNKLVGISGVDTRQITQILREKGSIEEFSR